jgi:hypothetical protein
MVEYKAFATACIEQAGSPGLANQSDNLLVEAV